ncbi:MAG: glutamate--tRNA ligase [Candidatus Eremiobacteraeota bacterium]|nr:glutamate--tRNA ligase [Candidatus Eremiobacteraeota bacterium]
MPFSDTMTLPDCEAHFPPRADLPAGAEVVRVAPSPTGLPHLGTALQAVIDRALADKTGGRFLLRIEDTDRARTEAGSIEAIFEGLRWLDLMPDEGPELGGAYGPYTQSERLPVYKVAARWLVEHGHAFHCICTPERLDQLRRGQTEAGLPPRYDGLCRTRPIAEVEAHLAAGSPSVIRMRIPPGETVRVADAVRGELSFESNTVDEQVLLKSDGFPTYHLAAVVDDHFMRITTVVRGEEWISSAPKHVLLYRYFGWALPKFLHTVLLRDAQKRKLSKRSGDTSIRWYRLQGYLPEAFRNFLTRIIWSHPEGKDVYPYSDFVENVVAEDLPKTGPVADYQLLSFINGKYIGALLPRELYRTLVEYLDYVLAHGENLQIMLVETPGQELKEYSLAELRAFRGALVADREHSERILALEPGRFRRLADVVGYTSYLFPDLFSAPPVEALAQFVPELPALARVLEGLALDPHRELHHDEWERSVRELAERTGIAAKKVFMLLRVVLTGSQKTPPLYEIIEVLGVTETNRRIHDAEQRALDAGGAASPR